MPFGVFADMRACEGSEVSEALAAAVAHLRPEAEALFVREPLVDPDGPEASDLDFLAFADVPDLLTERRRVSVGDSGASALLDLLWVPSTTLDDSERFARHGLMPHRLLSSRPVHDASGRLTAQARAIASAARRPEVVRDRLRSILNFGSDVVREIGVTWDFPPLARFWLQMARSAGLAALCDALDILCPNVYTRPLAYLRVVDRARGTAWAPEFVEALGLDDDPGSVAAAVRRVHAVVSGRFPASGLHAGLRPAVRAEYAYFLAREECDFRAAAAAGFALRGDGAAAVASLRFYSYALARIPMVSHASRVEGRTVAYLRPERAIRPALETSCPEILDDLARIWGGPGGIQLDEIHRGLDSLTRFLEYAFHLMREADLEPTDLRPWRPFRPSLDPLGDGSP